MRRDEINIGDQPSDDRPGDHWMEVPDRSGDHRKVMTWTGMRFRISIITLLVFACVSMVVVAVIPSAVIVKPGELSNPHAQILAGTLTNDRCRSCHSQSSLSPLAWLQGGDEAHKEMTQSELCMECHRQSIPENLASSAHNLPRSVREELTNAIRLASANKQSDSLDRFHLGGVAVDQNAIACSTCHKEHRGGGFDLTAMGNEQCQSCHSVQIGRFATSHPAWNSWPYGRGGDIEFDHASHQNVHFPKSLSGTQSFDCGMCHGVAGGDRNNLAVKYGELDRVVVYERSCQICHDGSMNAQAARGIDFVSIPILPSSAVKNIPSWPVGVIGPADGLVSPLTELLLRADPEVADLLKQIPKADLSRLAGVRSDSDQALRRFAVALQRLLQGYGEQGHVEVIERLSSIGLSAETFGNVLRTLPPQMVQTATDRWFEKPLARLNQSAGERWPQFRRFNPWRRESGLPLSDLELRPIRQVLADDDDLLGGESLLEGDLLSEPLLENADADPLASDPLVSSEEPSGAVVDSKSTDPIDRVAQGGWYRDDALMAIRYRAQGHADPVMIGLIETFAQLSEHDPLKARFFETPFVSACVSCHAGAKSVPARWQAEPKIGSRQSFTKFSHRPHLNIFALGDCQHCHRIATTVGSETVGAGTDTVSAGAVISEFEPLTVQHCAACHHPQAAGDNCTQCHRYHLGGF